MDGNKDEALRCISIAKEAIASGNKPRALKFIGIAQRLNGNLSVDDLLEACGNLDAARRTPSANQKPVNQESTDRSSSKPDEGLNAERSYTEEHVRIVRQIKTNNDYYAVLGVEKSCSVEDVRKAYRKLSLKVHPDKNRAPGSEEAFKKVSKAFKCLSDDGSRRQYDQTGQVDQFEYNQQHNFRRRRRRTTAHDLFDDEFDPDEIFRSFFGQGDMFRASHVYRTRGTASPQRENFHGGNYLLLLIQLLPILLIILVAYLPFSEPVYSLQKNYSYQFLRTTEKHEVDFFVKSSEFDQEYPLGTPARTKLEEMVLKDYKNMLGRYCHIELQRRQWSRNHPTPYCNKLKALGVS
ncbi:protein of unknown function DUF1977, DnaJ-like [Dillenia turbinata]|uniref:J domain-containing protein n=1 Tax=Dillenia turbinata TaxID=194707 RepID=A0AAN8UE26_9MAGN